MTRVTLSWLANHGGEAKHSRSYRAIESSRKPDISEISTAWERVSPGKCKHLSWVCQFGVMEGGFGVRQSMGVRLVFRLVPTS